jgi:hypothetical protein
MCEFVNPSFLGSLRMCFSCALPFSLRVSFLFCHRVIPIDI